MDAAGDAAGDAGEACGGCWAPRQHPKKGGLGGGEEPPVLGEGPQPAAKLPGGDAGMASPNSCSPPPVHRAVEGGGGNFSHGAAPPVLVFWVGFFWGGRGAGADRLCYLQLSSRRSNASNRLGAGKKGDSGFLCAVSPPFILPDPPARSSQKLGAAPVWGVGKSLSSPSRVGTAVSPLPRGGGTSGGGGGGDTHSVRKKSKIRRGGEEGGRSRPHLAGSTEAVSLR